MHHDGELILLAGALMGAGILAAFVADRVRIPGLLLFLGALVGLFWVLVRRAS